MITDYPLCGSEAPLSAVEVTEPVVERCWWVSWTRDLHLGLTQSLTNVHRLTCLPLVVASQERRRDLTHTKQLITIVDNRLCSGPLVPPSDELDQTLDWLAVLTSVWRTCSKPKPPHGHSSSMLIGDSASSEFCIIEYLITL